jgi:hypothetical protein
LKELSYQQVHPETLVVESNKTKRAAKKATVSKHQSLPDQAVDLLNDWFDDHLNNPYPTMEEKERLAISGGITVKQVNAWFSNRRNRSQNTRPKRIRREFEREIVDIVTELASSNEGQLQSYSKAQVIEKLQKTLGSTQASLFVNY